MRVEKREKSGICTDNMSLTVNYSKLILVIFYFNEATKMNGVTPTFLNQPPTINVYPHLN